MMHNLFTMRFRPLAVAYISALTVFCLVVTGFAQAEPIRVQPPKGAPASFADLIEEVSPAVVSINVITEVERPRRQRGFPEEFRWFFNERDGMRRNGPRERGREDEEVFRGRSLGSGFFISSDGVVVTNYHVVANAAEIEIGLKDGETLPAEIIGSDPETDLAVLQVETDKDMPYVALSKNINMRVGDWVIAMGNPFGLGGTATVGIVSATGREIGMSSYTNFLQIDAPINRGNSGGPVFDLYGRVVGVSSVIISPNGGSVGIGFAIPSDLAKSVTDTLRAKGKVSRGWLGVNIRDVGEDTADALGMDEAAGALVVEVVEDSPAQQAGFEPNDVIIKVNRKSVEDARDLTRRVGALEVDSRHKFEILRNEKKRELTVKLGERPSSTDRTSQLPSKPEDEYLGIGLRPLLDDERRQFDIAPETPGLLVTRIRRSSPLYSFRSNGQGVSAILKVNNVTTGDLESFKAAIDDLRARGRKHALLSVKFGKQSNTLTVPITAEKD